MKDTDKLDAMRRMAGVPERFAGCHMAMVDGYVVEGHVPPAIVSLNPRLPSTIRACQPRS